MRARIFFGSTLAAALLLPAWAGAQGQAADLARLAPFIRSPRFVEARLSPRGRHLALVSTEEGRRTLVVLDLADRKVSATLRAGDGFQPGPFLWVDDERLVTQLLADHDYLVAPYRTGRVYLVYANGRRGREILWRSNVVARIPGDKPRILVERDWVDQRGDRPVGLAKVNVEETAVQESLGLNPAPHVRILTDDRGEPRIAWGRGEDRRPRAFHREPGGKWQEARKLGALGMGAEAEWFLARQGALYVTEPADGGFALVEVRVETGERRVVSRNALVPPSRLLFDGPQRLAAVEYEPDLPLLDAVEPDAPLVKLLRGLEAAFPDDHVRAVNTTDDGTKVLVRVFSDRNPGRYLIADVESRAAEVVAEARPWIDPAAMAETTAFHIRAADGYPIHGYVTLPPGRREGAPPPPLVVLPHGGPHGARSHWEFDDETQLLAARGFAVLRVNYRGSGGYGLAFEEAGYRKWGTRMVDDIADATRYAIRKGWADATRICSYGASYGAYAAVQLAIRAPELIRCAAGFAGVYDLRAISREDAVVGSRLARGQVRTVLGEDDEALDEVSPARNAEKLTARVLLIHGKEDRTAPIGHAEALRDALTRAGRPPGWLAEPREGHGFHGEKARERMYLTLVAFLEENLAPATAP